MSASLRRKPTLAAFRHARLERLEDRRVLAATPIEVLAAGLSGTEDVVLEVNGQFAQRWNNVGGDFNGRQFQTLSYTHPTTVTADDVVVRMVDSAGAGKDLRVDGVRVDGVKYEAESPSTWNTGTWNNNLQSIVPSYAQSEIIYANYGALFFSASVGSQIVVRAAGDTGVERMELRIDDQVVRSWGNIGGDYDGRQFVSRAYTHPTKVSPDRIKVAFVNDGVTAEGADRNLRVDAVEIDGRRYESEAETTFSTGTWVDGSIRPRFPQAETLEGNGYFQYSAVRSAGSTLIVWAAGATREEEIGVNALGRRAVRVRQPRGQLRQSGVPAVRLRPPAPAESRRRSGPILERRDLREWRRSQRADRRDRAGRRPARDRGHHDLLDRTWKPGLNVQPGFVQDERLQANGVFQYGQDPADAGTLALGSTQYTVGEEGGFIDVEIVRTGGTRGAVTLDYTTVNGTAVAGQDFAARSGTAILASGQSRRTVRVPITNDSAAEGSEAFNVAADRVTGGAFLGQPRTTTVTILDDDAPNVGDGVGLRGEYFSDRFFGSKVLERTDPTIDFNWASGSPGAGVPSDDFSVRWTGQVEPLYSETYTFETRTDDGVRLWINDQQLINAWVNQAATTYTGTIALQAGVKYDIRMEYYERGGVASAELRWTSPSQAREIIPESQLDSELIIPDDGQFTSETIIASGLQRPTAIEFSRVNNSDYLYIAQQDGRVRLAIDGVLQSGVVVDYRTPVNNVRDRGLLGLTVHPNLTQNPYIYLLYTYDPPETAGQSGLAAPDNFGNRGSRLTRLTLDASNGYRTVVPGSDVVLLGKNSTWQYLSRPDLDSTQDNSIPPSGLLPNGEWVEDILVTDSQSHTIGALDFGPDGALYVTNGDGTSYGRVDPRTTRVQDLDSLSGKVLRINPITGNGYADNPFYTGDISDDRSKVYNYGLRNPFTLAVDPVSGIPYVGDVGWNTWEEINGGRGENFGWPYYEGGAGNGAQGGAAINRQTGGYRDLADAQAFYANGGDSIAEPPNWSRSHSAGGVAVVIGDFYEGGSYPSQFDNALFFTDFGDPTVRALKFDSSGVLQQELVVMGSVGQVVEMSMGPDGRMYYVDLQGKIGRINYQPGGLSASAALSSSSATVSSSAPSAAREPLLDGLSALASFTPIDRGDGFRPSGRPTLASVAASVAATDEAMALLLVSDQGDEAGAAPLGDSPSEPADPIDEEHADSDVERSLVTP